MLINGKTPEEIKRGLRWIFHDCDADGEDCNECECVEECHKLVEDDVARDALALIERLEAERDAALEKVPRWISVEERLPENDDLMLVRANGRIGEIRLEGAYVLAMYCSDGWSLWDYEDDEIRHLKILHWMPLPEPPKEGA